VDSQRVCCQRRSSSFITKKWRSVSAKKGGDREKKLEILAENDLLISIYKKRVSTEKGKERETRSGGWEPPPTPRPMAKKGHTPREEKKGLNTFPIWKKGGQDSSQGKGNFAFRTTTCFVKKGKADLNSRLFSEEKREMF